MSLLQPQLKLIANILLTNFKKAKNNSSSCVFKNHLTDFLSTSHELIMNFLQTFILQTSFKHVINLDGLDMSHLQTQFKLSANIFLTNFNRAKSNTSTWIFKIFLTNFLSTSYKPFMDFLQTWSKLFANILGTPCKLLTNFTWTSCEHLRNQ